VRGFLARKNTTACTGPIIYLLRCAKEGRYHDYNLGVILARILSYDVAHNDTKLLFAGAIATLIYKYIKEERKFKNRGTKIIETNLLDSSMLHNMGIIRTSQDDVIMHQFMVKNDKYEFTVLPHLEYFEMLSNKWIASVEEPSWDHVPAPPSYRT
jgi:hypothetical protein